MVLTYIVIFVHTQTDDSAGVNTITGFAAKQLTCLRRNVKNEKDRPPPVFVSTKGRELHI